MDSTSAGSQGPPIRRNATIWIAALIAVTACLATAPGRAVEIASGEAEARRVVQKLGESILAAMRINDLDARRRMLTQSAGPAVDFNTLGAGVLAYAEVQVPSNQRAEVMEGITAYIARIIVDEINQIHPDQAKLGPSAARNRNEVGVAMSLASPNRTIDAEWVVKNSGAGWRVTDIIVSGYSLTAHYGSQLGRRVKGSIEQLADMMSAERKLAPRFQAAPRTDMAYTPPPGVQTASARPASAPQAARAEKKPLDDWKLEQLTDLLRF